MSEILETKQTKAAFEAEGSKKAKENKKIQKEREKAEEDQQFVIDGAIIQCTSCMVPMGTLKVNFDSFRVRPRLI